MSNLRRNREAAVRQLLAAGLDYEQAAAEIGISPVTARKYVDDDFRREVEGKDRARREAARAVRVAANAERDAAIEMLFAEEAAKARVNLPPKGSDHYAWIFAEWRARVQREYRGVFR